MLGLMLLLLMMMIMVIREVIKARYSGARQQRHSRHQEHVYISDREYALNGLYDKVVCVRGCGRCGRVSPCYGHCGDGLQWRERHHQPSTANNGRKSMQANAHRHTNKQATQLLARSACCRDLSRARSACFAQGRPIKWTAEGQARRADI